MHELRPLFELGPLVVGRLDGDSDVDALLHRHATSFPYAWNTALASAAATERERAFQGVFRDPRGSAGFIYLAGDLVADGVAEL
jgi:hypothetical protein